MSKSYNELLLDLTGGPKPSSAQLAAWKTAAREACNKLGSDLSGVKLTDYDLVWSLLRAFFNENEQMLFGQLVQVIRSQPYSKLINLASIILGDYDQGGFNFDIEAEGLQIKAFVYPVPKGGNLREPASHPEGHPDA